MLPILEIWPQIQNAFQTGRIPLVEAPPGTGKTTVLPLKMLDITEGRIALIEPRRMASINAARRMAQSLGEQVGKTVGYRIRGENRISSETRIEVMTAGLFLQILLENPDLPQYSTVLLDEYHESHADVDLILAFLLESKSLFRDDLKLGILSATLPESRLKDLIPKSITLRSQSRMYEVTTQYQPAPIGEWEKTAVEWIHKTAEPGQTTLVFLPGMASISRIQEAIQARSYEVLILHASLGHEELNRVFEPLSQAPRIVLATSIAESSLTLPELKTVIDSGWCRRPLFHPQSGLSTLSTQRISQDSAIQRAGRAGRTQNGQCIRLYSKDEWHSFLKTTPSELLHSDLLDALLKTARWGSSLEELALPEMPSREKILSGQKNLELLQLTAKGQITKKGERALKIGLHPRLASMLLASENMGNEIQNRAIRLAARLNQNSRFSHWNLEFLAQEVETKAEKREFQEISRRLQPAQESIQGNLGLAILHGWPEQAAQKRPNGNWLLANGIGARLPAENCTASYLAVISLRGSRQDPVIELACPLEEKFLLGLSSLRQVSEMDPKTRSLKSLEETHYHKLVLKSRLIETPSHLRQSALLEAVQNESINLLKPSQEFLELLHRLQIASKLPGFTGPDSDWLMKNLMLWLLPFCPDAIRLKDLQDANHLQALNLYLGYEKTRQLDEILPTHWKAPSGSQIRIDYTEDPPMIAVRVQEVFGLPQTPVLANGAIRPMMHLLSPARRPVQITSSMEHFWAEVWPLVRKELRGRYPKHFWPEDGSTAQATAKTTKKMGTAQPNPSISRK